jgi:hypothetical protein
MLKSINYKSTFMGTQDIKMSFVTKQLRENEAI